MLENARGFVGTDREEAGPGVQGDITAAATIAPANASYGDDLAVVTSTSRNVDAQLDSASGGPRVHFGGSAPDAAELGGLETPGTVDGPGVQGDIDAVAQLGVSRQPNAVLRSIEQSVESHNQSLVAGVASTSGDLADTAEARTMERLRNINADNFYDVLQSSPRLFTLSGERVDLHDQFPELQNTPQAQRGLAEFSLTRSSAENTAKTRPPRWPRPPNPARGPSALQ